MKAPNVRGYQKHPLMILAENPGDLSSVGYERLLSTFLHARSPQTRRSYIADLRSLADFLGQSSIPDALRFLFSDKQGFANAVVLAFKDELLQQGRTPATVNHKLATLRSLSKMMRTIGFTCCSLEVENVRHESYRDTSGPGKETVRDLFALLQSEGDPKSLRDLAIVRLLYDLGLRRNEVASLDLSDIIEGGKIQVLGKGRRDKVVMSLPPETQTAISAWTKIRGYEPGPLFTNFDRAGKGKRLTGNSIYRNLMSLSRKLGKEVRPHGLRHTAVTEACKAAAREGIGLEEVRQFSRHRDVRTLMIYRDHEEDRQGQLAQLVAKSIG